MVVQKLRGTHLFPGIKHTSVLLLWSKLPFSDNREGSCLLAGLLLPKHRLLQALVVQPPCSRVRSVGETDLNNGRGICHSHKYLSRVISEQTSKDHQILDNNRQHKQKDQDEQTEQPVLNWMDVILKTQEMRSILGNYKYNDKLQKWQKITIVSGSVRRCFMVQTSNLKKK